ncbi:PGR5-like protein 1A, chloroplastic [Vitis vinifera]|uniref:PGR5-like protein 1A, chloroplastic n=1 Tax=Vitis vinifera TaxID=29760 RepID=A0A438BZ77_VITVI|nr:PGR5-like protein 1A, chloroplastic [Vitis vinifera]
MFSSLMATKLGFALTTAPRLFASSSRKPLISPASLSSASSCSRVESFQLVGRQLRLSRRLFIISPKATADQQGQVQGDDVVDSKILPYCSIDKKEKRSIGEMEQDFLQALQSFYYEGKAIMSNEEFDNLKEELMWEGSSVVMLSSDEQKFLEASMAYVAGNPIMSDEEFDDLKIKLKVGAHLFLDCNILDTPILLRRLPPNSRELHTNLEASTVSNHIEASAKDT